MNVEISREATKESVSRGAGASDQIDSGQVGTQDSDILKVKMLIRRTII